MIKKYAIRPQSPTYSDLARIVQARVQWQPTGAPPYAEMDPIVKLRIASYCGEWTLLGITL